MSNWIEVKLEDIADIKMGQSPPGSSYNIHKDGLPFYQGITDFGYKYAATTTYTNNPIKIAEPNDILFSVRAPVGEVNFVNHKCCVGRGNAALRMKSGNQEFLYYLLLFLKKNWSSISSGTVFQAVNKNDIKNLIVRIPEDRAEQYNISYILKILDDKIDLLSRQNENLEKIAQLLFKRWFVDFEFPDENGRPYKSSGGEMVISELGEIPAGWKIYLLEELTKVVTKGTTPTTLGFNFVDKGINFIKAESITSKRNFDDSKFNFIDEETNYKLNRSIIEKNDVLFTIAGTIGRFAVIRDRYLPANTNQAVSIIRLKDDIDVSPFLLTCFFSSKYYKNYFFSRIIQAVQANLSLGELKKIKLPLPNIDLRNQFSNIFNIINNRIDNNELQINSLENIRNYLLPKLMSGQIRIAS